MEQLKAYRCTENEEYKGGIYFAKSNLEARKQAANDVNYGELGGMTVKRAPWADKYGRASNVPAWEMVSRENWHFECYHTGVTINDTFPEELTYQVDTEEEVAAIYKEYENWGLKDIVGYQNGPIFINQQAHDEYSEERRKEKEFNNEKLEYFKNYVLTLLPDAEIIDEDGFGRSQYIYSTKSYGSEIRMLQGVTIAIKFPGMRYNAQMRYQPSNNMWGHSIIGPSQPQFSVAHGDKEAWDQWIPSQREKRNAKN